MRLKALFLAKSDSVAYRAGMLAIDGCFATASRETEGGDVDALPPSLFEWLYYCILKRDCPRSYSVLTRRIYKFLGLLQHLAAVPVTAGAIEQNLVLDRLREFRTIWSHGVENADDYVGVL